ncbi:MAG TPA: hypothetical protein VKR22_03570, partial [Acidimicrobiales bacterium]|nr:hypothetical protein [Acidimicrobiales bacterium]
DMVVFIAATVAGLRLPLRRATRGATGSSGPRAGAGAVPADVTESSEWAQPTGPLAALGPQVTTHPEVTLALSAMSVLRGLVGFLTFLLAFSLSRTHTAKWWFGFMLAASMAGAVVGVLLVPRARRVFTEPQMLALSIWSVALAAVLAGVVGGLVMQAFLAFVIGMAGASAKPAFDALVQRYVPVALQGRAFARFETRLQLVWVIGALLPVVTALPLGAGDVVIATVAGVAGFSYLTGRRAIRHRFRLR